MPGALKITNLTILHAHKPYKLFTNFPSPAAAVTAAVDSRTIPSFRNLAGWWCRITPLDPPAYVNITSNFVHPRKYGQNYSFYNTDSRNKGKDGRFHRSANNFSETQMGAVVNGRINESDLSPRQSYGEKPSAKPSKLLTLPTMLTIGRVAAIPILVCTFYVESWWGPAATVGIFITAATTDWLDGYLARKMKLGTPFGAFLDPVADKLMVATTLILLCTKPFEAGMFGQTQWLLTVPAITIICREVSVSKWGFVEKLDLLGEIHESHDDHKITMSAVREWAASRDRKLLEAVAVNNLGKWKTVTQMVALTILLAARDGSLVGSGVVSSGVVLLYASAWLSLWSLVVYMRKIWRVMLL